MLYLVAALFVSLAHGASINIPALCTVLTCPIEVLNEPEAKISLAPDFTGGVDYSLKFGFPPKCVVNGLHFSGTATVSATVGSAPTADFPLNVNGNFDKTADGQFDYVLSGSIEGETLDGTIRLKRQAPGSCSNFGIDVQVGAKFSGSLFTYEFPMKTVKSFSVDINPFGRGVALVSKTTGFGQVSVLGGMVGFLMMMCVGFALWKASAKGQVGYTAINEDLIAV